MNGIEMSTVRVGVSETSSLYAERIRGLTSERVFHDRNASADNGTCITWMGIGAFKCDGVASIVVVFQLGEGGRAEVL